jgi:hypothetical protein
VETDTSRYGSVYDKLLAIKKELTPIDVADLLRLIDKTEEARIEI